MKKQIEVSSVALAVAALCSQMCLAQPVLTAKTSHPDRNFFAIGSEASVCVTATGCAANAAREVTLDVLDYTRTNLVRALKGRLAADAKGVARASFALPTERYGVYYVKVASGETVLAKVGTAPEGYFSYAVLEDPAKMPDLDPWDGFLGEHCANYAWLWQRGGLGGAHSPSSNRLIVATTHRAACEGKIGNSFWTIETNAVIQAQLRKNLTEYVQKAIAAGPGRQKRRIYENLWEPNLRAPSPKAIVFAQRICWETIHALDPEALVCAYTSSGIDLRMLRTLMDLGLWKYMNALTVHPYKGMPEIGGFADDIRAMRRIVREYCGRDLPLFATESGMNEPNTPEGEWHKLCGQVRQALILKGEGFQLYCPFYGCDYGADLNNQADGDYGLNYNCEYPKVRYGCKVSEPRPVFAALAAFGRLTEAHFPTCTIEWLAETVLGYAFTDRADTDSVLALWDWGGRQTTVEIPVGREAVDVADAFGNVTRKQTTGGQLRLTLAETPCYVLHADPAIWGRAAQTKLKWSERRFKSANDLAPVGIDDFTPTFEKGVPGVAVTLANRTDAPVAVMLEVRVPGEPDCRKKARVTVPANNVKRVVQTFPGFRPPPTKVYEAVARVIPEKGTVAEMKESFNFLAVRSPFTFGDARVLVDADARYLKFDVTVRDTTPKNDSTGWWSWNGDALQIALARECLRKRTQNDLADASNQAYGEYTVARTPAGPQVCWTISWDPARFPCDTAGSGLVDATVAPRTVTHDGTSWHYTVSLPWEFINLASPAPGTAIRFALQCNDRVPDDAALHHSECFKLKLAAPRNFGWLVL